MGGHPVLVQASGRLGGTSPPEHCEAGPAPLGSWPVGVGLLCSWGWHGGASPVTSAGTWRGSGPPRVPGCVGPLGPGGGEAPGAVVSPAAPPSAVARSRFLPWPWHRLCPSCGSEAVPLWWHRPSSIPGSVAPRGGGLVPLRSGSSAGQMRGRRPRGLFTALLGPSGPGVCSECCRLPRQSRGLGGNSESACWLPGAGALGWRAGLP